MTGWCLACLGEEEGTGLITPRSELPPPSSDGALASDRLVAERGKDHCLAVLLVSILVGLLLFSLLF